jgi:hypothetical protein
MRGCGVKVFAENIFHASFPNFPKIFSAKFSLTLTLGLPLNFA